ncbi:uncharacterized protein LOC128748405 isoform X1 [Synchiropus splendidus]|uniref:uncharacterized protein LOC128748405 isoform X1 n=1 Tax=Synchiropus splendidus TaxID=270530 RepID=UPI00237DDE3A|nr:uncharacterized protein LOC128748405 isoform X1 [Synchiropus splendidus]
MVASHTSLAESNPEPPRSRTLPDSGSSSEKEEEQTPSREVRDEGRVRERKREWDRRSSCSAQTASSSRLSSVGDDSANKSETSVTPSGAKGIADSPVYSIAAFQEKYHEYDLLGEGGCGCVFAGFRRADNLPVAIKHISRQNHICTHFDENGKLVFSEVAIMARVASKKSSCVALLDWYLLEHELILVMERPVPSMDLFMYINTKCHNETAGHCSRGTGQEGRLSPRHQDGERSDGNQLRLPQNPSHRLWLQRAGGEERLVRRVLRHRRASASGVVHSRQLPRGVADRVADRSRPVRNPAQRNVRDAGVHAAEEEKQAEALGRVPGLPEQMLDRIPRAEAHSGPAPLPPMAPNPQKISEGDTASQREC